MTDIELLPCPMCGNKKPTSEGSYETFNGDKRYFIECFKVGSHMFRIFANTKEQVAKNWNTRFNKKEVKNAV